MTENICDDPRWWQGELRRLNERGPWDSPNLEATISDPHAKKVANIQQILDEFSS